MDNHMTDNQGRLVPADKVKPEHLLEDQLVNTLINQAAHWNERLSDFKSQSFADVKALMDLLAEKYQVKRRGTKGNMTLTSYDGLRKVIIANGDFINFGPELQIAKDLIDECISSWSEGINENLKTIIYRAFEVDQAGKINTADVLGLRRINIEDPTWKRAMTAIDASIKVTSSKAYIRFYKRTDINSKWESISLDIAAI